MIGIFIGVTGVSTHSAVAPVENLISNTNNPLGDGWTRIEVSAGTSGAKTLANGIPGFTAMVTNNREFYFKGGFVIDPGTYTLSVFAENQLGTLIRPFLYINELFADTALRVSDLVDGRAAKTFTISEQMTVEFRWGLGTNGSDSGSIDMGGIQLEVGDSAGPYSEG